MAHPLDHAKSSAKKFGGSPGDYTRLHNTLTPYYVLSVPYVEAA